MSLKPVFAPGPNPLKLTSFCLVCLIFFSLIQMGPCFTYSSPILPIFPGLFSSSPFLGRLSPALILPLTLLSSVLQAHTAFISRSLHKTGHFPASSLSDFPLTIPFCLSSTLHFSCTCSCTSALDHLFFVQHFYSPA